MSLAYFAILCRAKRNSGYETPSTPWKTVHKSLQKVPSNQIINHLPTSIVSRYDLNIFCGNLLQVRKYDPRGISMTCNGFTEESRELDESEIGHFAIESRAQRKVA